MFQIMVVEDDINARRLMQAVIEQNGYAAIPASDGAEALALMDKKHVDLIVLDVMMPHTYCAGRDDAPYGRLYACAVA